MVSPTIQIKPMNEGDNLATDNPCESDEDLPLIIDCSYESDEVESSPVVDEANKFNGTEFGTHFGSINSAGLNMTNATKKGTVMLLDDSDFNNKKCLTNKPSPAIKTNQEINSDNHILISDDEEEIKAPDENGEYLAECDIKIEENELVVEEDFSEPVDNEYSGVPNGLSDNLSNETGAETTTNDSQLFKCDVCPYKTSDETYFVVHKKIHRNKYRCNACFYVSSSAVKLLHHQKKRHMTLEELLYYCGDCSFASIKRIELVKHRREVHKIRRSHSTSKFKCPDCTFTSSSKTIYRKHRVSEHKDLSLKCSICRRVFLHQDDFEEHSLVHTYKKTEEGVFECKDCDFRSKSKYTMVYHGKMFHKKTEEARDKEFTCQLCAYKTAQWWRLEQHMQGHENH